MASVTQWTWVWVNFGSWWWTGRPGMLQSMGSQRVGYHWATELKVIVDLNIKHKTRKTYERKQLISLKRLHIPCFLKVRWKVNGITVLISITDFQNNKNYNCRATAIAIQAQVTTKIKGSFVFRQKAGKGVSSPVFIFHHQFWENNFHCSEIRMTDSSFDKHLTFSVAFFSLQDFQTMLTDKTWIWLLSVEESYPERSSRGKSRAGNQKWGLPYEGLRDNHRCHKETENSPERGGVE